MSRLSASGLGDKTVPCAGWSESQEHTNGVRVFPRWEGHPGKP